MSSVPPPSEGTEPFRGSPEVLRPTQGYSPTPQPMVRRRRSFWTTAPATYVLVGINCAVFLVMILRGVSPMMPAADQLMLWGANNAGSVIILGEWWRIV